MSRDFAAVTELAGTEISAEQIERMLHRYEWAAGYCRDKDVVEAACGSGQGLGMLSAVARSLQAGDLSPDILAVARRHYGDRIVLTQFDAQDLPFADASKDVVILFEALYYVPDAVRFVRECRRVLRPGGRVLIASANKDLSDFNPSPHSHRYFGAVELEQLFEQEGFRVELFGYMPVQTVSLRQKLLRPVKRLAVASGLMPKTMAGKQLLKRLVFGRLQPMPAELMPRSVPGAAPQPLAPRCIDREHKVIYCCATLPA